jgi:hypothetical protein
VLGVVLELFVVEEKLLACGEHKLSAAITTLQHSVGKFHGRFPRNREIAESGQVQQLAGPVSLFSYVLL